MTPEISVIITSYNRGTYLSTAIQSVLDSSFQNFELIISDDKSKDNSYEIACDFATKDNRIRVFQNESNIGDYPNRILSINRSNGKWIKFVDCDDFISVDCLQLMVDFANKTKANFGLCAPKETEFRLLDSKSAFDTGVLNYYGPTGSFFRKERYNELGGFVNRITVSDWHMWQRFAIDGPIMVFPERLATWRDHDDNTLKSDNHFYGVIRYYLISKLEILIDKDHPYSKEQRMRLFKIERLNTLKLSIRFSLRLKNIRPLFNFIKFNLKYFFVRF
jgi:glycosyltransferase involved in cell wall biosynthesis